MSYELTLMALNIDNIIISLTEGYGKLTRPDLNVRTDSAALTKSIKWVERLLMAYVIA